MQTQDNTKPDLTITEEPDGTVVVRLCSEKARFEFFELLIADPKTSTMRFFVPAWGDALNIA